MPASAPTYYLTDFNDLLTGVLQRYSPLLTHRERHHIATLAAISLPAQKLYARLINRRGPWFRIARLAYPEIENIQAAIGELCAHHLLQAATPSPPPADYPAIIACFTLPELRSALKTHAPPASLRKQQFINHLSAWPDCESWLQTYLNANPLIRIPPTDPFAFFRFLFFGGCRANLADFVTRALGHIVTETIKPTALQPIFTTRAQADDAFRLENLYSEFRALRESQTAASILSWWQSQNTERQHLHAGLDWHDRLIGRLGRLLEREHQPEAAIALYATSHTPPARERRVRLLLKSGETAAASAILQQMQSNPHDSTEAYAARQLCARLAKTARQSQARQYQHAAITLSLPYNDGAVETAVLAHYRAQNFRGVHSENWLWNSLFGLLLWDIIYDPAYGAFHSPLQYAPADLYTPNFYSRRQQKIESRLTLLNQPQTAHGIMLRTYANKQNIANPFVAWRPSIPPLTAIMLRLLPPAGLAAAIRHLAQNIKTHASGLPDLFIYNATTYRFIETKAEGDHLSPHQFTWLQTLQTAGINATLENIRRPTHNPTVQTSQSSPSPASQPSPTTD